MVYNFVRMNVAQVQYLIDLIRLMMVKWRKLWDHQVSQTRWSNGFDGLMIYISKKYFNKIFRSVICCNYRPMEIHLMWQFFKNKFSIIFELVNLLNILCFYQILIYTGENNQKVSFWRIIYDITLFSLFISLHYLHDTN